MKKYLYIFFILLIYSCKSDAELSIERGIQFYDWGKYNDALVEFNKSKFLQLRQRNQEYKDLKLLAQTHYNLAITYAKINMYEKAYQEAQYAVSLVPNKEYREVLSLIKEKLIVKNNSASQ
tara:strand:+ start:184 stop:546 length:363 start_codon:yes stop_codon:yes gene_type:complete